MSGLHSESENSSEHLEGHHLKEKQMRDISHVERRGSRAENIKNINTNVSAK